VSSPSSKTSKTSTSAATSRGRKTTKTPGKSSRSKSATARTPRTTTKKPKQGEEPGTEDEVTDFEDAAKVAAKSVADKAAAAAASVPSAGDDTATKLVLRVTYSFVLVLGLVLMFFPDHIAHLKSYQASPEAFHTSLTRTLGLVTFGLACQFIAAAQGVAIDQKHSLQYGMFVWLGLAAVAAVFLNFDEKVLDASVKKEAQMLVAVSLIFLGMSLWACYFS